MQPGNDIGADAAAGKAVVGDDHVGQAPRLVHPRHHVLAVGRGDDLRAPAGKQQLHALDDRRFIVDDNDEAAGNVVGGARLLRLRRRHRRGLRTDRHVQPEARAAPRQGGKFYLVAEQIAQTPDDGQPEAQAALAAALRIADLVELVKHMLAFGLGDADAAVDYFEHDMVAAAAAAHHHPAALGIAQGIAYQVAQDALEQHRIGAHIAGAMAHRQAQALFGRFGNEIMAQPRQHPFDRHVVDVRLDHAGVDLGDVEDFVEQLLQRLGRGVDAGHHVHRLGVAHLGGKRGGEQAQRMQRLAQVVAGRGKKAVFRTTRHRGRFARLGKVEVLLAQAFGQRLVLEAVAQGLDQQPRVVATEGDDRQRDGEGHHPEQAVQQVVLEKVAQHKGQQGRQHEHIKRPGVRGDQRYRPRGDAEHQHHQHRLVQWRGAGKKQEGADTPERAGDTRADGPISRPAAHGGVVQAVRLRRPVRLPD